MRTFTESASPTDATKWAHSQHADFVSELARFIAFPSVSAQPSHAGDMRRCASWLANHLRSIGLDAARVIETSGHPLAYADWLHAPGKPTLLIYGHYDVQPPEPLSEWRTPPFHPQVARGRLFGRGASDDKGQLFAHVKALESWLATHKRLPVNVRCVFEGEEEIGSAGFLSLLEERPGQFRSDLALVSDTPMAPGGQPAITYSLRGALSLEIEASRIGRDLHSGAYGGAIHNPVQVLCEILASLHDTKGHISIPGFYGRVRNWSSEERAFMAQNGPNDQDLLREMEASDEFGEDLFSLYERITIQPAVTINGIAGGYQGVGAKAVIPNRAAAKLNLRLAPDQDPAEAYAQLRRHIENVAPVGVRIKIRRQMAALPVVMDRTHPAMQAAAWACRQGFGMPPRFLRAGGTIPIVNAFRELLRMPVVLMGFASGEDALHAPNESFSLRTFCRAIDTSIAFLSASGSMVHQPRIEDSVFEVCARRTQPRKATGTLKGNDRQALSGPGKWVEIARSTIGNSLHIQSLFSRKPIRYDKTGKAFIAEYQLINTVTGDPVYFDRYQDGVFGDVKDNYAFLVKMGSKNAAKQLLLEAKRQDTVAKQYRLRVEWWVRGDAAEGFRLLLGNKYSNISVRSWSAGPPKRHNRSAGRSIAVPAGPLSRGHP